MHGFIVKVLRPAQNPTIASIEAEYFCLRPFSIGLLSTSFYVVKEIFKMCLFSNKENGIFGVICSSGVTTTC